VQEAGDKRAAVPLPLDCSDAPTAASRQKQGWAAQPAAAAVAAAAVAAAAAKKEEDSLLPFLLCCWTAPSLVVVQMVQAQAQKQAA